MRSYHATYGGGVDSLRIEEHDTPEPGPGEVLVEVRAATISFRDALVLRGAYVLPVKDDVVPLAEGAGVVAAVGPGVTDLPVGSRVLAHVFPDWRDGPFRPDKAAQLGGSLDGMLTEYAVLRRDALLPVPAGMDFTAASTLPCSALTAWHAVTGGRPVRPGETVLTLGSGGVSQFAIAFAKMAGARVIATTGDDTKADRLRALGADEVVNYRTGDWPVAVRELSGGRGADLIVEVAGTIERSVRAVARGGEIAVVGVLAGAAAPPVPPGLIFTSGAVLRPVAVGSYDQFAGMLRAIRLHGLSPQVERVFAFQDARAAFDHFLAGKAFGRVVVAVHGG